MDKEDIKSINIKKKNAKRNKEVLLKAYAKTCAIYGIFDCTCCTKDETINQPSTSRQSPELDPESRINDDLVDDFIDVGTDYIPTTENKECDHKEENIENKISNDVMEYINAVYEDFGVDNDAPEMIIEDVRTLNDAPEIEIANVRSLVDFTENERTLDPQTESITTEETNENTSIKSEVLPFTEEEEEIDVVNVPPTETEDNIHTLIVITPEQELNRDEIKTELNSDDENQIIDILNFDDTDLRENLVNNLENSITIINNNMETSNNHQNGQEDEIIDVESHDEPQERSLVSIAQRLRRRKRILQSRMRFNLLKRQRIVRSVMTIDLINSSRDDSIIEISDSPVVAPRKVTEIINVDDDDANDAVDENMVASPPPPRIGLGNCPVCLENLAKKEIMSTICGHVYCARCIKNVIKTTKKCPNCRKNLTLKSIHPLFI